MQAIGLKLRTTAMVLAVLMALAWATPALAAPAPLPQALGLVPADASFVLMVPNMSSLSQKLAMINDSMGLNKPELADVLGQFKGMTGMNAGLDDNGSLLVIVTDLTGVIAQDHSDPPMLILAPVTDYGAFVEGLGGQAGQAVTTLSKPGPMANGFAKQIPGYAVIGQDMALVRDFQPGNGAGELAQTAGKLGTECLASSDAFFMVNVHSLAPALGPKLQEELAKAKEQMMAELNTAGQDAQGDNPMAELAVAAFDIYSDVVQSAVRDTSGVVIGIDITEHGVGFTETAQFKPDSPLAGLFANGGGAKTLMDRLADKPYLMAYSMIFKDAGIHQLVEMLGARLPVEQVPLFAQLIEPEIGLASKTNGAAFVYYAPDVNQQQAMMIPGVPSAVMVVDTTDANGYLALYKTMLEDLNGFTMDLGPVGDPDAPEMAISFSAVYKPDVLELDGVQVSEYQVQYNLPPSIIQEMGAAGPMVMMAMSQFTSQGGYIAAKGPYVVMTTTTDVTVMRKALSALDQPVGLGSRQTISQVRAEMAGGDPLGESYISIAGIVDFANMFIAMMGQPPIPVPADLQPIGMSTRLEDHGVSGRLFIPLSTAQFCKDAALQGMMMMGGVMGPEPQGDQQGQGSNNGSGPPPAPH